MRTEFLVSFSIPLSTGKVGCHTTGSHHREIVILGILKHEIYDMTVFFGSYTRQELTKADRVKIDALTNTGLTKVTKHCSSLSLSRVPQLTSPSKN